MISSSDFEKLFTSAPHLNKSYKRSDTILNQGDPYDTLYFLKKGKVQTYMFTNSGDRLNIEMLYAPEILAPAFLFSDTCNFPVTVKALEDVEVIVVRLPELVNLLLNYKELLLYFLKSSANRACLLSQRIQLMSFPTIKAKIAHFLLSHPTLKGNKVQVKRNQSELAEFFSVARPSLARTISELKNDGIIEINKREYIIKDYDRLLDLF